MIDDEFHGIINFNVSTGLVPWDDPGEYVHTVTGKALDLNEEEVGTITFKLVSATEAINQGERLFHLFETDSSILEAVYATMFDANGEAKDELDIEPGWNNLLFLETVEIKAEHEQTPLRTQLIETSIAMFCPDGLIVAVEDSLELSIDEWRQLGFRRIADSPFVYRDQLRVNPYEDGRFASASDNLDEASYICDACGEEVVIPIDLSAGEVQEYVEDCPVCCHANVIHVEIDEDGNANVWAEPEED